MAIMGEKEMLALHNHCPKRSVDTDCIGLGTEGRECLLLQEQTVAACTELHWWDLKVRTTR